MMPELGHYLLCLATGLALLLGIYPQWGAARRDPRLMALARPLACALFLRRGRFSRAGPCLRGQ